MLQYWCMKSALATFDIDGVLADSWWRRHHLRGSRPDWEAFFEDCPGDPCLPLTRLPRILEGAGYDILFITSRPEGNRAKTELWLVRNVPTEETFELYMKPVALEGAGGDSWKIETLLSWAQTYDIHFIFEDCPKIITALRAAKLPVVPILSGYYNWQVRG